MRLMYDSTTPDAIPADAGLVAGYVNGDYPWTMADWDRFANVVRLSITVTAKAVAHVLDVETGDATPAQVPAWLELARKAEIDPTVYCNKSTWPEVQLQCQRENVPEPHYWIADPPEGNIAVAHLVPGSVATQYAWPEHGSDGHYDVSLVADGWPSGPADAWGIAGSHPTTTPPAPSPAPSPTGGDVQLPTIKAGATGGYVQSIQALLAAKAHQPVAVDGSFGLKTTAAVEAVQRYFHLAVDGVVGPQTWSTLIAL